MVDAFGPLGIEGPFRLACEISLSVMRKEKDLIMSVLRPFVYDPLVDWTKSKAGGNVGTSHLQRVEDRLTGIVTGSLANKSKKRKKSLVGHPLSVAGQVIYLITEATDEDNLVWCSRSSHSTFINGIILGIHVLELGSILLTTAEFMLKIANLLRQLLKKY